MSKVPEFSCTNKDVENPDGENWITVKRKRDRKRYPEQSRPESVCGENSDFGMSVASRRSYLFVSRLHLKTTEDKVIKYFHDKLQITCRAYEIKTRKDKFKSSFKLEIRTGAKQAVMSPNLWCKGIVINHFLHLSGKIHWGKYKLN